MATKAPRTSIDETKLHTGGRAHHAVGAKGVMQALLIADKQMGVVRSAETLLRVNQRDGFDCPGCAWPETEHRHMFEFCENGAKAVAEEATIRRVDRAFFERYSVKALAQYDEYWLGQQGRLTEPMILDEGAAHYRPISWDEALQTVADALGVLKDPNDAVFYTSGRASNEAAFMYQLLVRGLGTNNLPDCSNMCHESSGSALTETIGIGKGTVTIEDIHDADLIIVAGQNPGTNHPRMLSALEKAKEHGAKVVAVNPLPEAGLLRFQNPQTVKGLALGGQKIADEFLQIRMGGDQALFQALGRYLLEQDDVYGDVVDREFIAEHTDGFEAYERAARAVDWSEVYEATGLPRKQIERVGELLRDSKKTIICWAMGLTQHKHAVATLRDVVNVLLLQGNMGRPGSGVCPVRGHSNVQGDRTMGIYEKPAESFLAALDAEFGFQAPRRHGTDAVDSIRAMRDGKVRFFMALGGNFVAATPDTDLVEAAMREIDLTVQLSTKLNRSHVITGKRALILPVLGRTDRDRRPGRDGTVRENKVTVEDSMGAVHASRGRLVPPAENLLSEVAIIARISELLFGAGAKHAVQNAPQADWKALEADYAGIRTHIEHVVPGFDDFEARVDKGQTLMLPNGPRDSRSFATATGKARFTANELEFPGIPAGRLLLQTLRSHDQYNTTIYGKDDRYRGVYDGRRVILMHPRDIFDQGLADGDYVDLISEWVAPDGHVEERRADAFRVVEYDTPFHNAAAYYPETNVLVPLDSTADVSNTPTSKAVVIRVEKREALVPVG